MLLYQLVGAGIALIIGFALIMKGGSKFGWIFVAGAAVYGFYALQPVMMQARRSNAAPNSGGYYDARRK